jgi:membrane-bound metal-dependent hydrolase YbcI (DUF457 family)
VIEPDYGMFVAARRDADLRHYGCFGLVPFKQRKGSFEWKIVTIRKSPYQMHAHEESEKCDKTFLKVRCYSCWPYQIKQAVNEPQGIQEMHQFALEDGVDMVEPLLHFAVPFASLQAAGLDWRKAAVASVIALTPDLDVLFGVHRSLSHSVIVLGDAILALIALTFLLPKNKRNAVRSVILLGAVGVATHLFLDIFDTYIPILWPLLNDSFWVSTDFHIHLGSLPFITGSVNLLAEPTLFRYFSSFEASILTDEGIGVSLILLIPSVGKVLRNRNRAKV